MRVTVFLVSGPAGEAIGRGLLARDVTAERESERLHATFLNLVSHELRTPLGAIKGFASALRQDDLPLDAATRREFLDDIEAGADRLARIVASILDLSRIEVGALAIQREPCDTRELAHAALSDLAPELRPEARIWVDVPPHLPRIFADPLLTRQALRGLLDNALRYSPIHHPVRLSARCAEQRVIVSVADRGTGLAPADLGRVFEPFYRAGQTEGSGLGLGLAICHGLIRAQGGDVWAESRPGQGATFSISLQALPAPVAVGGRA